MTAENKIDFQSVYKEIKDEIIKDLKNHRLPENGIEWIKTMLDETVLGGKMNRGLTVSSSLSCMLKRELNYRELVDAHVLGWCIEFLQAFFLIADDIMDASLTRRGKPCWYRRDGVGMVAINDSFIVESVIYNLLRKYFKSHPHYVEMLELFHQVTFQTELGQLMDLITAPEGDVNLERFTIEKHAYIVEFKTAYYSFYLPIALAMNYAKITDPAAYDAAKKFLLALGEYFQIQDDYLDCYGSPEVIGKIGTDIEDNKCSWLIVQALDRASTLQREILQQNYGQKDPAKTAKVKQVYAELDIPSIYHQYEEESYKRLGAMIKSINHELLPHDMFFAFMNRIYKRNV